MKSTLIMILTAALCAAAFFTRPSEQDFRDFVKQRVRNEGEGGDGDPRNIARRLLNRPTATEAFLKDVRFEDRYLWVQVERDGRPIYTGLFDHWWDHSGAAPPQKQH